MIGFIGGFCTGFGAIRMILGETPAERVMGMILFLVGVVILVIDYHNTFRND